VQEIQARKNKSKPMIQHFTVKLSPAIDPREMPKRFQERKGFTPEDSAKLSQVKAKIEVVADYADMEKVRDLLKELSSG
jgi:hypothetical protein